jgi:hypothetical protein
MTIFGSYKYSVCEPVAHINRADYSLSAEVWRPPGLVARYHRPVQGWFGLYAWP